MLGSEIYCPRELVTRTRCLLRFGTKARGGKNMVDKLCFVKIIQTFVFKKVPFKNCKAWPKLVFYMVCTLC